MLLAGHYDCQWCYYYSGRVGVTLISYSQKWEEMANKSNVLITVLLIVGFQIPENWDIVLLGL